jgi:hypothetical protein
MWRPDFLIKKKERRCDGSISPTEVAGLVEEKEPRIVPVPECMQLALFGARMNSHGSHDPKGWVW